MKTIKQMIPIGILCIVTLISQANENSSINNIFQAIEYIKNVTNFEESKIESVLPYKEIQSTIQKFCPVEAVEQAEKDIKPLKNVRTKNLKQDKIEKTLNNRFNIIKSLIKEQAEKQEEEYKFCKNNYLLFSILETTQDIYKKNHGIITKITPTYKPQEKIEKESQKEKDNKNEIHNSASIKIDFSFIHDTNGLPNNAKKEFSETTEKYLQEIMADLVNIKILNENDLKTMDKKIKVTYQQSCEITEGAFRIIRNKQTGEYVFKEIELIIAYCAKNNTPSKQKRHVQQILAHELGHYIYFFKDKNPSKFSEICRDNGKINCLSKEFVSNYAKKSQEEDYAESFAYRYLYNTDDSSDNEHNSAPDNPINRRARYFEELFEKDDENDNENK